MYINYRNIDIEIFVILIPLAKLAKITREMVPSLSVSQELDAQSCTIRISEGQPLNKAGLRTSYT